MRIKANVEIDLEDLDPYIDEIGDYFESELKERFYDDRLENLLMEYIKELEADIYRNHHKKERTIESIYNDLTDIIKEIN